jgi:hypothetical protein
MPSNWLSLLSRTDVWIIGAAVIAFLVLTWALRGTVWGRPTPDDNDAAAGAPGALYRDRTVMGVGFGLVLILAGALVAVTRGIPWSLPLFALGFGIVLTLSAVHRRYRHSSPSLRRTIEFSSAFLNASLLAGILIVLNVIAFRYASGPLDLTRERTYSLSSLTLNQLAALDEPVTFTLMFGRAPRAILQHDRVIQLLDAYKAASPRLIDVVSLNPYYDLTRIEELAKRAPELDLLHGGGVLIEYGKGDNSRHVLVRNQEMFEPPSRERARGSAARFESIFTGEDEITSALIRLREGKTSKVGFTVGHGEAPTSDLSPRGLGVGNWKARLAKIGCEAVDVNLIQDDIPADMSILIVAAPRTPFKPEEVTKLKAHAARGGAAILVLGNTNPTGLDDFLKSFNLQIGKGLIVEPRLVYNRDAFSPYAPLGTGPTHPITSPLGTNRFVLVPSAAPISIVGLGGPGESVSEPVDRTMVPRPFLQTSSNSWIEPDPANPRPRFDQKVHKRGPVTVGAAVAQKPSSAANPDAGAEDKPRLVLLSSPPMATNLVQEIEATNLDLLMNAVSWLRGRSDTAGIAPKTHVALTLTADPTLRSRLILVPTVTAVLLILAVGISVFVARRE